MGPLQDHSGLYSRPPSLDAPSLCRTSSASDADPDHDLVCHCVATVLGHDAAISSMASAGAFLYTASLGNEICMWEQPDLARRDRFDKGSKSDPMCSVKALLAEGDTVFSAHQDHKIRAWRRHVSNLSFGVHTTSMHRLVATLPSRKDCLVKSLAQKNYVEVRRHHKKLWIEHTDTISALALGKSHSVLYSASWDKTVKVWGLSDLECVESIHAHDDAINAMVVCEKGGFLYTGSADGKVKVWWESPRAKKHVLGATMEGGHEKGASVNALALGDGGDLLFSGGSDGAVTIWGRRKGERHASVLLCRKAACHARPILSLCPITSNLQEVGGLPLLLSGSADRTAKVWQIRSSADHPEGYQLSCVAVLQGHLGPVKAISAAPSFKNLSLMVGGGCLVYTGSTDKSIKAWWLHRGCTSPRLQ